MKTYIGTGSEVLERRLKLTTQSLYLYSLRHLKYASEVSMLDVIVTVYGLAG